MSIRRLAAVFTALVAVTGAGYGFYWFHVAGEVRKDISSWAEHKRSQGWTVQWDDLRVTGFPGHVHALIDKPRLITPAGAEWQADSVRAKAPPFSINRLRVNASGNHHVSWIGGPHIDVTATSLRAEVNLSRAGLLEDVTLLASGLSVAERDGRQAEFGSLALMLDPLNVKAPTHQTPTVKFSGTAQGVTLPTLPGLMLDNKVALAEVTGHVMGAFPADASLAAISRWSNDGGAIELDHVALDWAPMGLEAEGTLALDGNGQPLASLSTRVRGFDLLMDRLAQAGAIDTGAASGAKILLSLFVKPDPKGRPAIPVPLSLQQGSVYLGPAKVAELPPVAWFAP